MFLMFKDVAATNRMTTSGTTKPLLSTTLEIQTFAAVLIF